MKNEMILVINGGSSSIKFQLLDAHSLTLITTGICERIFIDGVFNIKYHDETKTINTQMLDHTQAINFMMNYFIENKIINNKNDIVGVGHRVVHGGNLLLESKIIDDAIVNQIDLVSKLAPLHNKPELDVIKVASDIFNNAKHIAVFDTSFHSTIPNVNARYAIPSKWEEDYNIKRYGAHGTSHHYITLEMQKILNKKTVNLIICHIGNGASICAVKNSKSINTSMGLTPLEGLIMGTRTGDIDASIVSYVAEQANLSHQEVTSMLNKNSGMQALTGYSDFRDICSKLNEPKIRIGFDMYTKRITNYIVRYLNDLENECDAIVFTAGVGENTPILRDEIIKNIFLRKLEIDPKMNDERYDKYKKISTINSSIPVYCVRTNEEYMIAQEVKRLLKML